MGRVTNRSGGTTVSVGEMDNVAIAQIDPVMLERDQPEATPNVKMITASQSIPRKIRQLQVARPF